MNALRITFKDATNRQLLVQSTLDKSYFLNPREDEQVQFDRNALVIFKNVSESDHATLRIRCDKVDRSGAGIIFRSNRRSNFLLGAGDDIKIRMRPGETFQIRGEDARDSRDCSPHSAATTV